MNLSKQIQLILTEGKHTGSHKFAFLRAILDFVVEKNPREEQIKNPLIYFAEKFLTYYWLMYLNGIRQLTTTRPFLFYRYLDKIIDELGMPPAKSGFLSEKHIHTLWDTLKVQKKLSSKIITALNRTRISIFNGPVKHTHNVTIKEGPTKLDFYEYPNGSPYVVRGRTYSEFYKNEPTFVSLNKRYIRELKEMYFWFDKAILTAWAEFTDKFPSNREKVNHTGLTLLQIPEPKRKNMIFFRQHFRDLGVDRCAYCDGRPFGAVDHIIPWKMVKSDQFWNLLPICSSCNSSKAGRIWKLNAGAKKLLRRSIRKIVDKLDEYPDFRNQVIQHYTHIREDPPLGSRKILRDALYDVTINRIEDFYGMK